MKKIISILLTVVMLAGLFTVNVSATNLDEVKQESLELYLFEDIVFPVERHLFATRYVTRWYLRISAAPKPII